jgi:3-dehydroquinate dehydratase/shikimate dehydrogenase
VEQLRELVSTLDYADMVEIRLDYLNSINFASLKGLIKIPIIITIRSGDEGGFFTGTKSDLINLYQQAIDAGMDYIDIDYRIADSLTELKFNEKTKLVLSYHSEENEISTLRDIFKNMTEVEAEIYKLIFSACDINDNLTALNLINYAIELDVSYVIHAQGDEGSLSRILGSFMGNAWTYVSESESLQTAPGQLSMYQARKQYYLHKKNQNTHLIGLVGYPISQSKGWLIFNELFQLQQTKSKDESLTNSIYLNLPVKNLSEFWNKWNDKLNGLSVTIPHKENILRFVDNKSAEVKLTGVCNAVVKKCGQWYAHNTDYFAIIELLKPYRRKLSEKSVLIYGTGATARSVIVALQSLNIQGIFLMGRNKERGRVLEKLFSITFLEDESKLPDLSAIIQTTPVGMYPKTEGMPDCVKYLNKGMIVFDVIFNPPTTRFLQTAQDKGCTTISGEEMYFLQAIKQFKLFTGNEISLNYFKKVWKDIFTAV